MSTKSLRWRAFGWAGVAAFCLLGATAQAGLLDVGQTLFPAPAEADPTGGLVVDFLLQPFNAGTFTGVLTSAVIQGDPSNPLGGLTFTYQVSNDSTSQNVQARLTVNGFAGWSTDASYQIPVTGISPALADRITADVVGWSFLSQPLGLGPIQPGQQSALLVVQSNAPDWKGSVASVIDGSVATIPTFGPVPEPTTLALLAVGGIAVARRRR